MAFITTKKQLTSYLTLTEKEELWFDKNNDKLPFLVSEYYLSLIDTNNPNDPIRKQVIPTSDEFVSYSIEDKDPQLESSYSIYPRLIRRYKSRVALLVTDKCTTYCRHCFRRRFTSLDEKAISDKEIHQVGSYLKEKSEVKEILITGGDPLTLSDQNLLNILKILYTYRNDLVIRIGSRVVVTYPDRITPSLISKLKESGFKAIYVMSQFNHPSEITPKALSAIDLFIDNGILVLNQTVLLKGINDDVATLETLMNNLVGNRIKPYYLFQGDLVSGTNHFRVPLEQGLEIEKELRRRLSGLAMPLYAVDLPNGGGKVPIVHPYLKKVEDHNSLFENYEGNEFYYPDPI